MPVKTPYDPREVGRRVEALRVMRDMTRKDFAASVAIDETSYGKIEKGTKLLKAEMAFRIAERWGVSMDFLYRGRLTELPPSMADSLMAHLTKRDR